MNLKSRLLKLEKVISERLSHVTQQPSEKAGASRRGGALFYLP
jgi:hypothetical protein